MHFKALLIIKLEKSNRDHAPLKNIIFLKNHPLNEGFLLHKLIYKLNPYHTISKKILILKILIRNYKIGKI